MGQTRLGCAVWRRTSGGTTGIEMIGVHTVGGAVGGAAERGGAAHQQIMSNTTAESRVEIWPASPGYGWG